MTPMRGFNHLTLRIKNLEISIAFYCDLLGMTLVHQGKKDAYLQWGEAWICLLERDNQPPLEDHYGMDHVAFSINENEFHLLKEKIAKHQISFEREPVYRGGGLSFQFRDPDGILLEYFTGTLEKRMETWK
jgi:metallothiol transferase